MHRRKVVQLVTPEIERLSKTYVDAREQRRKSTDTMRRTKAELKRRGFDEYGVSLSLRSDLRRARSVRGPLAHH